MMTIDLTSDQEATLQRLGEQKGKTPAAILVETAVWLESMEDDDEEWRIIDERIAEADRGAGWLSHEEVGARLQSVLSRG